MKPDGRSDRVKTGPAWRALRNRTVGLESVHRSHALELWIEVPYATVFWVLHVEVQAAYSIERTNNLRTFTHLEDVRVGNVVYGRELGYVVAELIDDVRVAVDIAKARPSAELSVLSQCLLAGIMGLPKAQELGK